VRIHHQHRAFALSLCLSALPAAAQDDGYGYRLHEDGDSGQYGYAGLRGSLAFMGEVVGTIPGTTPTSMRAAYDIGGGASFYVGTRLPLGLRLEGEALKPGAPGMIWDRQLYELDVFAIPKGNGKRVQGIDFIRYVTGSSPLAAVAGSVPYGPARRSSLAQVGKNPELGISMRRFLPTDPANFRNAFAVDDGWWLDNAARIAPLWKAWRLSH